jgi:hypothetical protein
MGKRMHTLRGFATIIASLGLVSLITMTFMLSSFAIPHQEKQNSSCVATISIRPIDTDYPGAQHYKEGNVRAGIPYEFGVNVKENKKFSGPWGIQVLISQKSGKITSDDIKLKYYDNGIWKVYPFVLENGHWKGFLQIGNKMAPCQTELVRFVLIYNHPGSYVILVDAIAK